AERVRKIPSTVMSLASRFPCVTGPRSSYNFGPWLSIGTLEPRKNFDLLLDAYEIYRGRSKSNRRLLLAGEGAGKAKPLGVELWSFGGAVQYNTAAMYQTANSS